MKIIDRNGRLFGKISVIDLIVVAVVIVMAFALYVKTNHNEITSTTTPDTPITYQIQLFRVYPFLADSWGSARFSRQSAYDLRAAQELGADAVAVEIVERNLYWLCEQAALFPAQLRELETAGAIPGSADMDIEPDKAGGHVVSGGIFGDIDVDSPVYIEYNGACYEALLINGGYSALLPGEGGGDYGVCWYSGGSLVRADISI